MGHMCTICIELDKQILFTAILEWVTGDSNDGDRKRIEEDEIRIDLPDPMLDSNVDLRIVQDFFTQKGYQLLKKAVNELRERDKWSCPTCLQQCADNEEQWICCDACLYWYHLRCTGRTKLPKNHTFFCRACLARASK